MTTPTLTAPPATVPNKYGGDPVAFDAAMQAWLTWEATRQPEEVALVTWANALALVMAAQTAAAQADRIICAAAQAAVATQSPVVNAAAAAAAVSAINAGAASEQAATASATAATQASAATSSATAANTALLALGNVLANGVGAITVDANGDLSVAYNSPTVTSMAIDGAGNFTVTYPT